MNITGFICPECNTPMRLSITDGFAWVMCLTCPVDGVWSQLKDRAEVFEDLKLRFDYRYRESELH